MPVKAQFNTIGDYNHKVDKVAVKTQSRINGNMDADTIDSDSIAPMLPKSFSPPLDEIHVTSPYGMRWHPIEHRMKFHNGVDLRAKMYSPVYAMFPSIVIKTGYDKRSGHYITLQAENIIYNYCHLSMVLCPIGRFVDSGEMVALSGNSGQSTAEHLHCHISINQTSVNPLFLINIIASSRKMSPYK